MIKLYGLMLFMRCCTGVFQAFISIYSPIWVDQFGPRNRKTVMMSLIQAASPLGIVLGYGLTAVIQEYIDWTYSFIIFFYYFFDRFCYYFLFGRHFLFKLGVSK